VAYAVKFNANGGSGGQSKDVTATYGSAMPAISTTKPARAGYTFQGWYDNADYAKGTQYYTAEGASARKWDKAADTTLYAGWEQNYTVTYACDGSLGSSSKGSDQIWASARAVTLPSVTPKPGFAFLGWTCSDPSEWRGTKPAGAAHTFRSARALTVTASFSYSGSPKVTFFNQTGREMKHKSAAGDTVLGTLADGKSVVYSSAEPLWLWSQKAWWHAIMLRGSDKSGRYQL